MLKLDKQVEEAARILGAAKVDQWELMAAQAQALTIGVRGDQVDKHQASSSVGLALRVINDHRVGFSYVFGADGVAALEAAAREALASASAADPEPGLGLAEPAGELPRLDIYDPAAETHGAAEITEQAKALAAAARRADKRVVHVHPAEVSKASSRVRLLTSTGIDYSSRGSRFSAGAAAVAAQDQERGNERPSPRR